jgi:hypothetical protein
MNFSIDNSGVPSPYTENTITCITCGKQFAFSQTAEGRCLRDHIAHMENERRQLMARGGGGGAQAPIVVQGPTINMSNQQSTNVSAVAQASATAAMYGRPRVGFCRRWRNRFLCLFCLLILGGTAYGIAMAITHPKDGAGGGGSGGRMTMASVVFSNTHPGSLAPSTVPPPTTASAATTTTHSGFFPWRTTATAATTVKKRE